VVFCRKTTVFVRVSHGLGGPGWATGKLRFPGQIDINNPESQEMSFLPRNRCISGDL